jgi:hypothetical protein
LRIAAVLTPVFFLFLVSPAAPAAPVSVPADIAPFVTDDYRFDPDAFFAAGRLGPIELPAGIRMYPGALARVPVDGLLGDRPVNDLNWSGAFSSASLDGTVRAIAVYQDGLAVGGDFVTAGDGSPITWRSCMTARCVCSVRERTDACSPSPSTTAS